MKKATKLVLLVLALCLLAVPVLAAAGTITKNLTYRDITIDIDGVRLNPVDVNGSAAEPFIIDGNPNQNKIQTFF